MTYMLSDIFVCGKFCEQYLTISDKEKFTGISLTQIYTLLSLTIQLQNLSFYIIHVTGILQPY